MLYVKCVLKLKSIVRPIFKMESKSFRHANMNKSIGKKQTKAKSKQKISTCRSSMQKDEYTILTPPIKSISDKKEYRVVQLKNGLRACLISDLSEPRVNASSDSESSSSDSQSELSESDESHKTVSEGESNDDGDIKMKKVPAVEQKMGAAGLTISVGNFSDPSELPGLAHFVEHMVFMGSEKFPRENDFDSYIKKRGGSDNASTDCETTTFYFDCIEKHLFNSLDKFAQFFIAPLMKEDSMTREREAIESEFVMAIPSDSSRKEQLLMSLFNPEVPINSFAWGSLQTLKGCMEDKLIYKNLHAFRERHYSAHRMTLAIQARLPLDTLQSYVVKCFSKVPTNKLPPIDFKQYSDVIFNTPSFNRIYYVLPMKDTIELNLIWSLPPLLDKYKSKPQEYVSWLLGDEGKGSLFSYLRRKVWALAIFTGNDNTGTEFNSFYSIFKITITLTQEGLYHLSEVIEAVYSYIMLLNQSGIQERIFNEIKLIEDTSFRFSVANSSVDYVEEIAESMQFFPPEDYLRGSQLYFDYDPEAIKMVLSHLVPQKMNVMVLTATLPHDVHYDKIEPHFNIHYADIEIPKNWKNNWLAASPFPEFAVPTPNIFLTNDFSVLPEADDNPRYPEKILENSLMEVWYRKDQIFKLPIAHYYYCFVNPLFAESAFNACMTDMIISLLLLQLSEEAYPAVTAELSYSIYLGDRGIIMKIYGYNEKLPVLIELIMTYLKNFSKNLSEELFEAVKDKEKRIYYNRFLKPATLAKDVRFSIILENYWTLTEKYAIINDVTFETIKAFSKELVNNLHIQCLVQGNVDKEVVIKTSKKVLEIIQCEPLRVNPRIRVLRLPPGEYCCRVMSINKQDRNSIIANYYQAEPSSMKTSVIIEILMMFIEEPMFDILRTKEQLGYNVSCSHRDTYGILGFSIGVNAQKRTPQFIDYRVETFIKHVHKLLKKMTVNKINEIKRDLIKLKRCADDNLKEEMTRNWSEIVTRDYMFDRLDREIKAVEQVKLADVRKFWEEYNTFGSRTHLKKLSVQVVGYEVDDKKEHLDDIPCVDSIYEIKDSYSLEFITPTEKSEMENRHFITDIKEFKSKLVVYPTPVAVIK